MNLRILQLGDSALPIGGFSHSWGLEAAIFHGAVRAAADLERWIGDWLMLAAGPLEGVVLAAAFRAAACKDWPTVLHANELLGVSLAPPTLRNASRDMGDQLLSLAESWPWCADLVQDLRHALPRGPWHHATVFGALAIRCEVNPAQAVAVWLHQAALGMIGAGVRAIPIGHTHGQQILARLQDFFPALAADLAARPLETAGSSCPAYEVTCHDQSRLYTRLFRS